MIIISHRANLNGKNKLLENNPSEINKCILLGFDVELDVWMINNQFFLGHDDPQYKIEFDFLKNKNFWCHAKNKEALYAMLLDEKINCFWHQNDNYTLTSHGFIWVFPGEKLPDNSIAVMPENTNYSIDELKKCYAICTDIPIFYKNLLK